MYIRPINKVFIPIPKCATGTLKWELKKRYRKEHHDIRPWEGTPDDPEAFVVMWRDPIDRFESAWNFLARTTEARRAPWLDHTFQQFCDKVLAEGFDDIHTRPQSDYEVPGREMIRIPWDFEAFAAEFDLELPLHRRNHHERCAAGWTRDLLMRFERRYERDLEIWGRMD